MPPRARCSCSATSLTGGNLLRQQSLLTPAEASKPPKPHQKRGYKVMPVGLVNGLWCSQITSTAPPQDCRCNTGGSDHGTSGKERTGCGRMLLVVCAAATCRGVWFSHSYTEELPRDKQPQIQELPRWEYNSSSCRMVTLSLLSPPQAGRFTGVLLCTHIHG